MLRRQPSPEELALKAELASISADLAGLDRKDHPVEHAAAMADLERVHALLKTYRREMVNPNTVLSAAASLGSVLVIVGYENKHVFTSAAKNFVPKINWPK